MTIKLEYLVGSKEMAADFKVNADTRMWNIITKTHPRYRATPGVAGLTELGILRGIK